MGHHDVFLDICIFCFWIDNNKNNINFHDGNKFALDRIFFFLDQIGVTHRICASIYLLCADGKSNCPVFLNETSELDDKNWNCVKVFFKVFYMGQTKASCSALIMDNEFSLCGSSTKALSSDVYRNMLWQCLAPGWWPVPMPPLAAL